MLGRQSQTYLPQRGAKREGCIHRLGAFQSFLFKRAHPRFFYWGGGGGSKRWVRKDFWFFLWQITSYNHAILNLWTPVALHAGKTALRAEASRSQESTQKQLRFWISLEFSWWQNGMCVSLKHQPVSMEEFQSQTSVRSDGGLRTPWTLPPGHATGFSFSGPGGPVSCSVLFCFCHRMDYNGVWVWKASGTYPSKVKPSNPLLLVWLLIMVIRACVIFLSTVYADAVKVKPFRNRFFAPA